MAAAERGDDVRQMNGVTFTAAELAAVVERVISAKDRSRVAGLDDKRADIILGGALLLDEVFAVFELEVMTISDYALREGMRLLPAVPMLSRRVLPTAAAELGGHQLPPNTNIWICNWLIQRSAPPWDRPLEERECPRWDEVVPPSRKAEGERRK